MSIKSNIENLKIPLNVRLIAISKKKSIKSIEEAYKYGQKEFGESYIQESIEKINNLKHLKDIKWHFIGKLQSKKAAKIAEFFDYVQSIDRKDIVTKIDKKCRELNKILPCLIQINIGREPQKSGIMPERLEDFLKFCKAHKNICIEGLMCIPPAEDSNKYFEIMKILFDDFKEKYDFKILSMGMSNDYNEAISAGSNMVRIGTAIFGQRVQ